jgi:PAS domain S-box-containing protein
LDAEGTRSLTKELEIAIDCKRWHLHFSSAKSHCETIQFYQPDVLTLVADGVKTLQVILSFVDNVKDRDISRFFISIAFIPQASSVMQSLIEDESMYRGCNWFLDCKSGKIKLSEAFAKHLGYESSSELPNTLLGIREQLIHKDDHEKQMLHCSAVAAEGFYHEFEGRFRHKSGHYLWISCRYVNVVHDVDGEPLMISGMHCDITGRKELEMELQREKELLEDLIEKAPFGLFKGKTDGTCVYTNDMYCNIMKADRQTSIENWQSLFCHEDAEIILQNWTNKSKDVFDGIFKIQRQPHDEPFYVRVFWRRDSALVKGTSMGLLLDATSEVLAKQKLEQQAAELKEALHAAEQATRFKSEFLAVISHEIR